MTATSPTITAPVVRSHPRKSSRRLLITGAAILMIEKGQYPDEKYPF